MILELGIGLILGISGVTIAKLITTIYIERKVVQIKKGFAKKDTKALREKYAELLS